VDIKNPYKAVLADIGDLLQMVAKSNRAARRADFGV